MVSEIESNKYIYIIVIVFLFFFFILLNFYFFGYSNSNENNYEEECIIKTILNFSYEDEHLKKKIENLIFLKNNGSYLFSLPRFQKTGVTLVFPVTSSKSEFSIDSLNQLLLNLTTSVKLHNSVLLIFEDSLKSRKIIVSILNIFLDQFKLGFLQVMIINFEKISSHPQIRLLEETFHISNFIPRTKEEINSLSKNQKMLFFIRLVTVAGSYIKSTSSSVLFIEEGFQLLFDDIFSEIAKKLETFSQPWSCIDFSDHLSGDFLGKLIPSNDIFKFCFFYLFFFTQNPFFPWHKMTQTHMKYFRLTFQSNYIILRPALMVNGFYWNGVINKKKDEILLETLRGKHQSQDPMATLVTNMVSKDSKHNILNCYSSLNGYYFHAVKPKVSQFITIVFDSKQKLTKLIVESGLNGNGSMEVVEAVVQVSPKISKLIPEKNLAKCVGYKVIGNLKGKTSVLELNGNSYECLKITINKITNPPQDLIIKQLAIFTE